MVIARAIVSEPTILLADEPTGNLDPGTAEGVARIFKDIHAKGTTILIATHNRELYRNTGKRVLRLDSGNLVGEGPRLMIAPYALKLAIQSLLKEKWINLLSVLTIAAGLFIISVSFFAPLQYRYRNERNCRKNSP